MMGCVQVSLQAVGAEVGIEGVRHSFGTAHCLQAVSWVCVARWRQPSLLVSENMHHTH